MMIEMPDGTEIGADEDEAYDDHVARVDDGLECPKCGNRRPMATRIVPRPLQFECAQCRTKWTHFSRERT